MVKSLEEMKLFTKKKKKLMALGFYYFNWAQFPAAGGAMGRKVSDDSLSSSSVLGGAWSDVPFGQ